MRKITYASISVDGEILSVGSSTEDVYVPSDDFIIIEEVTDSRNVYYDWKTQKLLPIPARPSDAAYWRFNYSTKVWEDPRNVEKVRSLKIEQINQWRAAANQSEFTYQGKQIAVDRLSRSDIDGVNGEVSLTGALPANFPGGWKTKDNTYVAIPDVATWVLFYKAMTAQGSANFLHSQTLKAQVAAATTIAEIEAITW